MRLAFFPLAFLVALDITSAEHAPSVDRARALQVTSTGLLTPSEATSSLQDSITWTPLGSSGDLVGNPAGPVSSISGSTSVTAAGPPDGSYQMYQRLNQGTHVQYGFPDGMPLILVVGSGGGVTLSFDKPISAFAIYIKVGDHGTCPYRDETLIRICYACRACQWELFSKRP